MLINDLAFVFDEAITLPRSGVKFLPRIKVGNKKKQKG